MIVCGKGEERGRIYEWEVNSYLISNTLAVGELVGGWMECNNNPTIIYWGLFMKKGSHIAVVETGIVETKQMGYREQVGMLFTQ